MFRFEDPGWLLLSLLLAPILYRYARRKGSAAVRFPSLDGFGRLPPQTSVGLRHLLIVLRATGMGLVILALARPQAGQKETEILSEGVDIVLCLDTSGSMQALDFEIDGKRADRLTVVKKVVLDFIRKRQNDRIGMVVFGEQAFTQCPLTLDYGVLMSFVERLRIGMAGDSTAIGSGLATSVKRIKDMPGKSKVVILLTDGRNNTGRISPQTAAELAKAFGVKVYTIGVGGEGESPFLVDTLFGKRYVYQKVDLDEDTLRKIADTTGGLYFRATDTASLEQIYDQIDQMEKSKVEVKEYTEYEELFPRFVLAGLLLLLAEFFLTHTWFAKIP